MAPPRTRQRTQLASSCSCPPALNDQEEPLDLFELIYCREDVEMSDGAAPNGSKDKTAKPPSFIRRFARKLGIFLLIVAFIYIVNKLTEPNM